MKKLIAILALTSVVAMNATAQVWYSKNSTDPVTDERTGRAGVRSIQRINYDHPYLIYICDDEGERIQIKTREIHSSNRSESVDEARGTARYGNFVWFRIDGGDMEERDTSLYGEYDNAPTVERRPDDAEFDKLLQSFRDAKSKIAVKTQRVTFTTSVSGSNSKIGEARRFCGLE